MKISEGTKISALIKYNPQAIEIIASINSHFEKLRNPILRKVLASRVSISDAARIGKCHVDVFFERLATIGFVRESAAVSPDSEVPSSFTLPLHAKVTELDVTGDIGSGNDPFMKILSAIEGIPAGEFLAIINSFEPTPLITILTKKKYSCAIEHKNGLVYTYVRKNANSQPLNRGNKNTDNDFDSTLASFKNRLITMDVSAMEMPGPMLTILNELKYLADNTALHVYHRRVPQLLLPELKERGINILIKQVSENSVELLIYK